jgi:hypothetical protein
MQSIEQQIKDDVTKVIGDKNTLAAIDEAIESTDYGKKFHANWMIARGFYNLGMNIDWTVAVERANDVVAKEPDDLGCKMAFIDADGVETLIIPGKHGGAVMRADKTVELYGKYKSCNLDVWMALDGISLTHTLLDLMTQGLPFMGLLPILDSIIEKKADREEMTRLHAKFRSFLS